MELITDFHLHSRFARACSKYLTLPNIAKTCEQKGIDLVGTGDITHPIWRAEISEHLEELSDGIFALKDGSSKTRFLLSTELSCIYKRHGKVRRVHHVVLFSSLEGVDAFIAMLKARGCNLKADGRPILGIDSEELVRLLLDADPNSLLIPAHAWTPWFAVFGSQSGFDSLEECFGEMTPHIHAIETGLSSDPAMNHRLSLLDSVMLVSNSDAHSLEKLGREANVFEMERPSYSELRRILVEKDTSKFLETIEFFPEEGKYHADGHRKCAYWCLPAETKKRKGMCPKCGKQMTVGVLHRVDDLADRENGKKPKYAVPFRSIVPLAELISDVIGVGPKSKAVQKHVDALLASGKSEFELLLKTEKGDLDALTTPDIAQAILLTRAGKLDIRPGYDGEYGVISVQKYLSKPEQKTLL